jgi:tetrahydromethanopterin S-methyltransferase subunit A
MILTENYIFDDMRVDIKIDIDSTHIFIYIKTIQFIEKYKKNTELLNLIFTDKIDAINYIVNNLQNKYNNDFESIKKQINNLDFTQII